MKKYLTYLLSKNKRTFALLTVLFIIIHPLFLMTYITNLNPLIGYEFNVVRVYSIIALIVLMVMATITPILIQRKQMSVRGADLAYALPIKKEKRMNAEMIYGWLLIFIPFIISCILAAFLIYSYVGSNANYLCSYFIYYIVIACTWYLFTTFIVSKCNSLRDAIIVVGLYLMFFFLLYVQTSDFFYNNSITIEAASQTIEKLSYILEFISPVNAVIALNYHSNGMAVVIANIIYCILFVFLIKKSVLNKQAEKSGDISESKILYPLVLFLIVLIMVISSANKYYDFSRMLINYILLFICYGIGNFIAQRNFKLKVKHVLLFVITIGLSYCLQYVYIQTDCFHDALIYKEVETVKKISLLYDFYEDDEYCTYSLDVLEDDIENVSNAIVKLQDYLLSEYKENYLKKDRMYYGRLIIEYDNNSSNHQIFSYNLNENIVSEMTKIFKEYDLEIHKIG